MKALLACLAVGLIVSLLCYALLTAASDDADRYKATRLGRAVEATLRTGTDNRIVNFTITRPAENQALVSRDSGDRRDR